MTRHTIALFLTVLFGSFWTGVAVGQQVPESVRQELRRQGMTLEEARRQAEQFGIDLSNPQQAVQRARELGIPEARIQALLQAMQAGPGTGMLPSLETSGEPLLRPMLSGGAVVAPDTVLVSELPVTVSVRIRLQSETTISRVEPFFLTSTRYWLGPGAQPGRYAPPPAGGAYRGQRPYRGQQPYAPGGNQQYAPGNPQYAPGNPPYAPRPYQQGYPYSPDSQQSLPRGYTSPYAGYNQGQPPAYRGPRGQSAFAQGRRAAGYGPSGAQRRFLADTLTVGGVRRVQGTVNNGVWEGRVTLPIGLSPGVFALRVRVTDRDDVSTTLSTNQFLVVRSDRVRPAFADTARAPRDTLQYFGYDVFRAIPDAFRPGSIQPAGEGYVVGPSDELRLTVWGAAEFQYDLTVDQQGRIFVPNVGQFTVAGHRLEVLRTEVREWLSQKYAGLSSDPPTISMDLAVTRLRPVHVYVLGEVGYPGGYTVGSGSTVFNVLYSVGGPLRRGSLRNIQVIRGGDVVATVDIYDYLMRGYNPNPVQLQNNDYIYIPPRGETVGISGEVKRPAYFEMKQDETLRDLLAYAGDLKPQAYAQRIHIERIVPFDERTDPSVARRTVDVNLRAVRAEQDTVSLADADFVSVPSILEANSRVLETKVNAVKVTGAVYQPGQYELDGDLRTVRDLVRQADGLRGDAYRQQAELVRIQDDLDESVRTVDLTAAMADNPRENIVLQPGDSLYVASVQDLKIDRTVRITGQVLRPGTYTYRQNMTVRDLLFKAGGLTDEEFLKEVFKERADLYRESPDGRSEQIVPFHLGAALDGEGFAGEELQPGDEIRVYSIGVEVLRDRFVEVSGAVKSPGRYKFRENITLEDLILQAGGFQEGAFLQSVEVTRRPDEESELAMARTVQVSLASSPIEQISFGIDDTTEALQAAARFQLQHRDRVFVRTDPDFQEQTTVVVRGEVQFPGEYTLLRENETLSSLIARAGGVRPTGYPKGGRLYRDTSQVIVEMGRAIQGEEGNDVILQPGDEIVIPPQPNTVAIRGNVANEGLLKYRPGERVAYYLERAGGTLDGTKSIYLTQASGATFEVETGWFRRTPRVDDGAIIRVTREPPAEEAASSFDLAQVLTDTVGILSSALTVIVLSRRAFD